MGDLVWVRFFFPGPMELEIFSPTYNGVRFFISIIRHERYFFQCRILFFPGISLRAFFTSKLSQDDKRLFFHFLFDVRLGVFKLLSFYF